VKTPRVHSEEQQGIVTLGGQVASDGERVQAETLAKSLAGEQVVADQIAVIPVGAEKDVAIVNADLDGGIEKNLDAALGRRPARRGSGTPATTGRRSSEGAKE
jgi:osmotically-inducible protein OsmY